jgi:hypothetical protein
MHFRTHVKRRDARDGQRDDDQRTRRADVDEYTAGMIEHDMHVGQLLALLDELGIADETIVHYSTDNGPHYEHVARRRRDALPRREEHQLGRRLARPGHGALAGRDRAGLGVERDHAPHGLAADLSGRRRAPRHQGRADEGGVEAIGREYKVHLDGYNFLPYFRGETEEGPRREIFYFSDDGDLTALRFNRLEGDLPGAPLPADAPRLGRALDAAAHPAAVQPAPRPL